VPVPGPPLFYVILQEMVRMAESQGRNREIRPNLADLAAAQIASNQLRSWLP
jgi:hypothetical protein